MTSMMKQKHDLQMESYVLSTTDVCYTALSHK